MKEREVRRYLEYMGLELPHPSERTVVRPPSGKEKPAKTKKRRSKR